MGDMGSRDAIRAGDAERDDARETLIRHFTAGRLDLRDFEERTGAASAGRTIGELKELFTDLPAPHPLFATPTAVPVPFRAPSAPTSYPHYGAASYPSPYARPALYGYEPTTGRPYSDKSRVAAGVLQIFLGAFGAGRLYSGDSGVGVAQLLLTLLSFGLLSPITVVWGIIDGILILTGNGVDREGRPLR